MTTEPEPPGTPGRSLSPAVTRAAAALDAVAAVPGPVSLSDLARAVGMPKSTAANITTALVQAGLLRRREGGFVLGERLAALGAAYIAGVDEVRLFHECRHEVEELAGETLQLATLGEGMEVTYLARAEGAFPVRLASAPGRGLPASCTATGKAMLANDSAESLAGRLTGVGRLPRLTANSITSRPALVAELEEIRRRGWAVDREEVIEGVVCVAVALEGGAGSRPLAVSCTLLAPRAEEEQVRVVAHHLAQLARRIDRLRGSR